MRYFQHALLLTAMVSMPASAADLKTLTGQWRGVRPALEQKGLTLELIYTLDALANVSGGRRRGLELLGEIDLLSTLELEPLLGWQGGKLYFSGLGTHGGDPSDHVGDAQVVSNIAAFDTWKLYEAWFEQRLWSEKVGWLLGLYDLNSELEVIPTAELFLHSSQGIGADIGLSGINGPSVFPTTSLGSRLELRPVESFYVLATVLDGVSGDPDQPRGTQVILRSDDGLLLASEIGFLNTPRLDRPLERRTRRQTEEPELALQEGLRQGYFGKYGVGVWGYTTEQEDFFRVDGAGRPRTHRGTHGAYLFGEQRVYCEPDDRVQGLSVFARIGAADDTVNPVDSYLGGGLVYRGFLPGRDRDRLGLAVAAAHFGADFRQASRLAGESLESWEVTVELTYRVRITRWCQVQPDLQYVVNPGGSSSRHDALVMGARLSVTF